MPQVEHEYVQQLQNVKVKNIVFCSTFVVLFWYILCATTSILVARYRIW